MYACGGAAGLLSCSCLVAVRHTRLPLLAWSVCHPLFHFMQPADACKCALQPIWRCGWGLSEAHHARAHAHPPISCTLYCAASRIDDVCSMGWRSSSGGPGSDGATEPGQPGASCRDGLWGLCACVGSAVPGARWRPAQWGAAAGSSMQCQHAVTLLLCCPPHSYLSCVPHHSPVGAEAC